jgi:hypothetical protein
MRMLSRSRSVLYQHDEQRSRVAQLELVAELWGDEPSRRWQRGEVLEKSERARRDSNSQPSDPNVEAARLIMLLVLIHGTILNGR